MRARCQQGMMIRNASVTCPGWSFNFFLAEGVPGALAAEPQASAAGSAPVPKAMPKAAFALASRRDAEPEREPTPPPPQRRTVVMTLGVQLCLRWFGEGQQMDPPQVVHRLDVQAYERGRGGGRGPRVDQDDVESTAAEMLRVTNRPHGTVIVVDARGFKLQRQDTHHVGAY